MRIAVAGGGYRAVEVVYLAQKAGFETVVMDKDAYAPAAAMGDQFIELKTGRRPETILSGDQAIDLVISLIEDKTACQTVESWTRETGIPLLTGPDSTATCRNAPHLFPSLENPLYAVTVLEQDGVYKSINLFELTRLKNGYATRVATPDNLTRALRKELMHTASVFAGELKSPGMTTVHFSLTDDRVESVLVDIRQFTGMALATFWAENINILKSRVHASGIRPEPGGWPRTKRHVVIEHIKYTGRSGAAFVDESFLKRQGPLEIIKDFFGADEAITNYAPDKPGWVATMIFSGRTRQELESKRQEAYIHIAGLSFSSPELEDMIEGS